MENLMICFLGQDTFDAKGLAGIIWAWSKLRVKQKDHQKRGGRIEGNQWSGLEVWMLEDDDLGRGVVPYTPHMWCCLLWVG